MPYRVETALSGRAGCQSTECKDAKIKIDKGELRLGTWVELPSGGTWFYRHWGCITGKVLKGLRQSIEDPEKPGTYQWDMLDGYASGDKNSLDKDPQLQEQVRRCITQGFIDPEDWNGDPEMNVLGALGMRTSENVKKAREENKARNQEIGSLKELVAILKAQRAVHGDSLDAELAAAQADLDRFISASTLGRKTPATKKRVKDEADAEEGTSAKKKRATKKKAKAEDDEDEDEDVKPAKPAAKSRSRAKKVKIEDEDKDESSEEPKLAPAKKSRAKKPVKKEEDSGDNSEEPQLVPAKKSRAKKRAKKEEDSDDNSEEPKLAAAKKSRAKKPVKKEEDSGDNSEEPQLVPAKKSRAKKRVKKEEDSDDNSEEPKLAAAKKSRAKKRVKKEEDSTENLEEHKPALAKKARSNKAVKKEEDTEMSGTTDYPTDIKSEDDVDSAHKHALKKRALAKKKTIKAEADEDHDSAVKDEEGEDLTKQAPKKRAPSGKKAVKAEPAEDGPGIYDDEPKTKPAAKKNRKKTLKEESVEEKSIKDETDSESPNPGITEGSPALSDLQDLPEDVKDKAFESISVAAKTEAASAATAAEAVKHLVVSHKNRRKRSRTYKKV